MENTEEMTLAEYEQIRAKQGARWAKISPPVKRKKRRFVVFLNSEGHIVKSPPLAGLMIVIPEGFEVIQLEEVT